MNGNNAMDAAMMCSKDAQFLLPWDLEPNKDHKVRVSYYSDHKVRVLLTK